MGTVSSLKTCAGKRRQLRNRDERKRCPSHVFEPPKARTPASSSSVVSLISPL